MANVQIYQLDGVSSNLDNSALLACDITNPDVSERATTPKVTRKLSVAELESQVLNDEEYTTELNTTNQTIFGAINELHTINGYSYDAYDDTATYAVGDLCIYNNTLYKCTTAITTAEAWNASHWTATSIADEINEVNSSVGDIDNALNGYKFDTFTLETNKSVSVVYDLACIAVIGRGSSGLYYGHWSGVNAIVTAQNHSVTHSTVSGRYQLTIANNTGMTDRITVIYH